MAFPCVSLHFNHCPPWLRPCWAVEYSQERSSNDDVLLRQDVPDSATALSARGQQLLGNDAAGHLAAGNRRQPTCSFRLFIARNQGRLNLVVGVQLPNSHFSATEFSRSSFSSMTDFRRIAIAVLKPFLRMANNFSRSAIHRTNDRWLTMQSYCWDGDHPNLETNLTLNPLSVSSDERNH